MILFEAKLTKEQFINRLKDPKDAVVNEQYSVFAEMLLEHHWVSSITRQSETMWDIQTQLITREDTGSADANNVEALFEQLFQHSGWADKNELIYKKIDSNGAMLRWRIVTVK